ncbi:Vps54-like protein-domain-containing protein [Terfezia claveryi]|nr:Vps54-like protein-domain-containing protein [Terfezia claveryi]
MDILAISTLVENPNSRSLPPRPTTRDIPPVTLTPIPKVKAVDFAPYLTISAEYEKYLRAKDLGLEEHIRLSKVDSPGITPTPSFADLVDSKLLGHGKPSQRGDDVQSTTGSFPANGKPARSIAMTPLNTVPPVYFDDNFHLENPRTFDVVSERSEVIRSSGDDSGSSSTSSGVNSSGPVGGTRKALATNAILQEKLSWYMDTVEVHLISSISQASSSFFTALGDLRELHSEAAASVQRIQSLRNELTELDKEQAIKGLEIVRLRKRRANLAKLEGSVKQIERLLEQVKTVGFDLEKGNIEAALDGVDTAENLLLGKPIGEATSESIYYIDLGRVKALDAVKTEIAHLRHRIGKVYETRFVDTLLTDLQNHVEKAPLRDTLRRWCTSFQREQGRPRSQIFNANGLPLHPPRSSSLLPEYTTLSESLRQTLSKHLDGLQRARSIHSAIQAYRDAVLRETKSLIRRNMPSSDDDSSVMSNITLASRGGRTAQEKSAKLAKALRELGPIEAEDLYFRCYCGTSELVRRLGSQQKLLLDLTSGMGEMAVGGMLSPRLSQNGFGSGSPGKSGGLEDSITTVFSDLISPALDIAQGTLLKIVRARNDQTTKYGDVDFLRYFTLNKLFFAECEAVSGRVGGSGLQTQIGNQIKEFLTHYHRDTTNTMASTLEKDKWGAKDCDEKTQEGLNRIVDAATVDPEIWVRHAKIFEDTRDTSTYETTVEVPTTNGTANAAKAPQVRNAMVEDQPFILPESSLKVLQEIERYEGLIVMMPGMTSEIAANMLDFLKIFNSRACQLILGAGATKSAGLKNITTKHLALASQGLSIIISLMPYLRECSRRHAGPSAVAIMAEFDKVKRAYQDHQEEIHNKLISIMSDRLSAHIRNFPSINWEASPDHPNTYMETLVKETLTLNKVLSKHLPPPTLMCIMGPVFANYKEKLMEVYSTVELKSEGAKEKMLKDVELFREKLGKLDGCGGTGEVILEMVKGKIIAGTL